MKLTLTDHWPPDSAGIENHQSEHQIVLLKYAMDVVNCIKEYFATPGNVQHILFTLIAFY